MARKPPPPSPDASPAAPPAASPAGGWWSTLPGIITGAAAVITAVTGLIIALKSAGLLDPGTPTPPPPVTGHQAPDCRAAAVQIASPGDREAVTAAFNVSGSSTPDPDCRYVFLIVQDVPRAGRRWRVIDIPQLQRNGAWAARAVLDHIPVGAEATLVAHVTADPGAYRLHEELHAHPAYGATSNFVTVRRVQ